MKKHWMILTAAMTAVMITACGSGDGIVINGTKAADSNIETENTEEGGGSTDGAGTAMGESKGGTKIEIVTGETTQAAEESAAESLEGQTEPANQAGSGSSQSQTPSATTAPTTAAPTTAAPTTAASTTAAQQYTVTDVKKTMYATSSVRVRSGYSTSSDVLGALAEGEKVEVTGESANGWMRVNYKGHVAYVSKSYLTETAPAATTAGTQTGTGTQTDKPTSTTNTGTTPGGSSSGPTASGTTTSGGTTTPGGSSNGPTASGTTPGGSNSNGPTSSGTTTPGGSSSGSGASGSVTGNVTALDPSGVTIQSSDGTSYQFTWGDSVPALAPGEKVQVQYSTDSSGQKIVTQVTK